MSRSCSGIGLETAHRARAEGAEVILAARRLDRLRHAAADVCACGTAALDATDPAALERFFAWRQEADPKTTRNPSRQVG